MSLFSMTVSCVARNSLPTFIIACTQHKQLVARQIQQGGAPRLARRLLHVAAPTMQQRERELIGNCMHCSAEAGWQKEERAKDGAHIPAAIHLVNATQDFAGPHALRHAPEALVHKVHEA